MTHRPVVVTRHGRKPSPRRSPERARLTLALLLSLLVHVLLLRVTFDVHGLGFPGFGLSWTDRRIEMPDLRVVLARSAPAPQVPEPSPTVEAEPAAAGSRPAPAADPPATQPRTDRPADPPPSPPPSPPASPPPMPATAVIDLPRADVAKLVVPILPQVELPSPVPDADDAARSREQSERARQEEAREEAARAENARQEIERQEAARIQTARVEAARVEAARADAERAEAARVEVARAEVARLEAERQEAARIEAERLQAERQEAARSEAAKAEAARLAAEKEDARRDAVRRALGRQLDEEADRRDAAAAARQSPSWSPLRRYRLFGRSDPNGEIIRYADAWSRKIQMNMTIDMVREAAKERHADPLVTVAVRSDGSVESVTFVRSSGVAAIDAAILGIVESQKPYPAFPPELARDYDVIEIRRTWHFDVAVRLY